MPRRLDAGADHDWLLPARLKPAEKRSLDLIADWPWLAPEHLEGLMGVGRRRVSQLTGSLEELGLVAMPRIERRRRLVLTDRALTALAHRDRASPAEARRRWSAGADGPSAGTDWREVPGRRSRQLLRHIGHTESVHGFAAALSAQARDLEVELAQLDPPHRASRYFRLDGRLRSIQPDAFVMLHAGGERLPAVPGVGAAGDPAEDDARPPGALPALLQHAPAGGRPRRPAAAAGRVRRSAGRDPVPARRPLGDGAGADHRFPCSSRIRELVRRQGPLGAAWRTTGRTTDGWQLRDPLGSL